MSQPVIQTSFNAGEWAPALNARVDLAKYHSGAALIRNFFVDYRGGATTRPGSRYIAKTFTNGVTRLVRFQASFTVSYVLEFGNNYIRFYNNGAPVLEATTAITAITQANPGVITSAAHGYTTGNWVFISTVGGMTQLNGNYYIVNVIDASHYSLTDLFGNVINTTAFTAYTAGGTAQRVYTVTTSPYTSAEVFGIKFAQNINQLILCHPNHPPFILTLVAATNWTLAAIVFGSTIPSVGTPSVGSSLGAGLVNYAYIVTAVDINNQESSVSPFGTLTNLADIRSVGSTNTVSWSAVAGAISYNVYRAEPCYSAAVPAGSQFGFIGNVTGLSLIDSNIIPDFSQGPPLVINPFAGSGVQSAVITNFGGYTSGSPVPTVTFTGGGGSGAAALITLRLNSVGIISGGGGIFSPYNVGEILTFSNNVVLRVATIGPGGTVTGVSGVNFGYLAAGICPVSPISQVSTTGTGAGATFSFNWVASTIAITSPGTGYTSAPAINFSAGGALATATLGASSSGNPSVPGFFQQRLVLAGPPAQPMQFNMSQAGAYFNYNVTQPVAPDNAIQGVLVTGQLNTIQSMIPMPPGLIMLTDKGAWLINGGTPGSAVSATQIVANSQAYNGASFLQPIVCNYDILYVQAKGSIVRDLTYNFYTNIFTGADISILSSHLFYTYTLTDWAWAEEPFKVLWAVRNDGILLSLTFQKDQELIAWAHSDTLGSYQSVVTITEQASFGAVDAVYTIVSRAIQGQQVQYIERFTELFYPSGYKSAWQVDAGIGYNGAPATVFSGAQHLGGLVVTGLADGVVINFTMPVTGTFQFGIGGTTGLTAIASASIVTVGLGFTAQLQTLALDLGEPTQQGKRKKVSAVTTRVRDTLGLQAGRSFTTLTTMKDLVLGNVGTMSNQLVTGLVTSDARTIVDPQYDTFGQFCLQQSQPYPASILGVIPEIELGDDA